MKKLLLFSVLLFLSTFTTAQTNFIKQDTVYGQSSDCVGGVNVCIDSIKFLDAIISGFTYTLDGQVYNPLVLNPCTVDTIYQYNYRDIYVNGEQAPIELLPSKINGQLRAQVFPDFNIFLDSLKVWGPAANWTADTTTKDILNYPLNDTFRFLGKILGRKYDLTGNQGFDYKGLLVKAAPGFHQFIVKDVINNKLDTVTLRTACIQKDTVRQTVNVGNSAGYSVITSQLLGTPQSASFKNLCVYSTTHVNFTGLSSPTISYAGVTVGTDTACLKICDQYGICDTTILIVTAQLPPSRKLTYRDSVAIGAPQESRCSILKPSGSIKSFDEFNCATRQGHINYTIDKVGACINFTAASLGFDTVCIRVCNTFDVCDTSTYILKAIAKPVAVDTPRFPINDIVVIGTPKANCSIQKPTGSGFTYSLESKSTTGHVGLTLDAVGGCVNYTGLTVGQDSIRVLTCNSTGSCVRTIFYVTAQNAVVVPDTPRTVFNKIVTIGTPLSSCDIQKPSTGTIAPYTIESQSTTGHVTATVDNVGGCINLTGLTVGQDSFRVLVCNTLGSCVRTIYYVTAQNPVATQGKRTTFNDNVVIGAGAKQRCDIVKPTGTINSYKIVSRSTLGHVTFALDTITSCLSFTGLTVGTDSARVIVCNTSGVCDTTVYYVAAQTQVLVGRKSTFQDSVIIGQPAKTRTDVLIPSGIVATIKDVCSYSRTHVQFNIDQINNRVSFFGLSPAGTDSICLQVCNTQGLCDTTIYDVKSIAVVTNYKPGKVTYIDSVAITGLPRQRCDLRLPPGNIISFENYCPPGTSPRVQFTIDAVTNCVIFKGLSSGVETGCFKVCNALGQCDTTIYIIRSRPTISPKISGTFIIKDTITEGVTRTRGDLEIPDGALTFFANICPNNSGNEVFFAIDPTLKTITYQGVKAGFDTACIRVCNVNQVCDTTVFIIETKPLLNVGGSRKHFVNDSLIVSNIRSKCDLIQPFNATTIRNLCPTSSGNEVRFDINQTTRCIAYTAVAVGVDSACIEICDGSNLCDTTYLYIKGLKDPTVKPTPSEERITIKINERFKFCPDTTELAGSPITSIKFCEVRNYDNVDFKFLANDPKKCVLIGGLSAGKDTFCIAIQNQGGFTDTTRIYVTVLTDTLRPSIGYDSLSLKIGESGQICPDQSELWSGIITDLRNCTNTTIDNSTMVFNPTTKCVELRGLSEGRDTMCVVLCNSKNICDTTIIYVKVSRDTVKPISSTEVITLNLGDTLVFSKIDSTQIFGSVDTTYDACPGSHGTIAQLTLDRFTKKVTIKDKRLAGGPERMCIVVCNKTSKLCDTTFLLVTYKDTAVVVPINIKANDDFYDSIKLGRDTFFRVYNNDLFGGKTPISLKIVTPSKKGVADTVTFKDGIISYKKLGRSSFYCGTDSFRYRVCVLNGRDTVCSEATVSLNVICSETLKVANGFSPNNDTYNETFFIDGLAAHPDNTVLVYNRWGNEVLKAKNYQNDWHGDWKGKDLPDGTYFYLIRDDANGEVLQTGWVVINR
jgi:gliding motility-associated-like protein